MGTSGQATEWTSQQILDRVLEDEDPEHNNVLYIILLELKKINIQLSEITGEEIDDYRGWR